MYKDYIKGAKVSTVKRGGYKQKQKDNEKIYDYVNMKYKDDIECYRRGKAAI